MIFFENLCIGCGACRRFCKRGAVGTERRVNLSICRDCPAKQDCAENCPAQAMKLCGALMSTAEVLREVLRDRAFYGSTVDNLLSRGGVTCSGGEPLLQADFVAELLEQCCQEGVGTCVDTTLNLDWSVVERVLPFTELFLVDLKLMDDENAKKYTGMDNRLTVENLNRLSVLGKPVILRIPLLMGLNDTPKEEQAREKVLAGLSNIMRVDRFYVTNHAASKYRALQRENRFFNKID